jgi:APA family basic amino acid/polyamine antiporter
VFIGLGSMIGAGVFAAFTPAAQAAGTGLLVGLVVAAFVALCNALASAQLAAQYPNSGGTYLYARERLGAWWGFTAGWGFLIGKTASCAAMALTFAAYAAPSGWERVVAVAAVIVVASVNYRGIAKTALATTVIVLLVGCTLAIAVGAALPAVSPPDPTTWFDSGAYGIFQSAGLLFFAFAGYARVATLGEEVRDPQRTIPFAILTSLAIAVLLYAAIGLVVLGALGADGVAESATPLGTIVAGTWVEPVVRLGAALASLGALLGLMAGIGRTGLAMARDGELPAWLASVHPRFSVPHRVDVALAVAVVVLVIVIDVRAAIGFSSLGVLIYYFIANVAAFTQKGVDRRYPRALQLAGAALCVALVATLPPISLVSGLVIVAAGIAYRLVRTRFVRRRN